jgi:hypothetical protein
MALVTIVYWRDIPAQVGARDTDAYLAEWRKADPVEMAGDPQEIARAEADRLEAEYDLERIKTLIANDGWA